MAKDLTAEANDLWRKERNARVKGGAPYSFHEQLWPDHKARTAPRPSHPGCWANVLVYKEAPQYADMLTKSLEFDADPREYLHCQEGIWVTRLWLGHDVIR